MGKVSPYPVTQPHSDSRALALPSRMGVASSTCCSIHECCPLMAARNCRISFVLSVFPAPDSPLQRRPRQRPCQHCPPPHRASAQAASVSCPPPYVKWADDMDLPGGPKLKDLNALPQPKVTFLHLHSDMHTPPSIFALLQCMAHIRCSINALFFYSQPERTGA